MKNISIQFLTFLFLSISIFSCDNDDDKIEVNVLDGLTKLSEGYATGTATKVEIWAAENYYVGFNNLVVVLYDSLNLEEQITDATVMFAPLMTMNMGAMVMKHACPMEQPVMNTTDETFEGSIAFIMPSGPEGFWNLGLSIINHKNNTEGMIDFDITVDNPEESVLSVFTSQSTDSSKLVLSMLQPIDPKVGMNDIEFAIHKKASMMSFPADDSYTIEIEPEMPSMGHGSPNNVNPVNTGNGHYLGKVNFTMTGEWKINILVKKDGEIISKNANFYVTF